ncbi:MAG: adenosylcobinamide-GDP ribazoletransferase [Deltaproteobacteria bacterium]|nr:adenosylcobinamide-GDP ribazoletransferase [Deltaproteobacteria bacterium]
MVKSFLIALQLLTIIPVRVGGEVTDRDMARSAVFFPAVGALIGILAAAAAVALRSPWSPEIAAAVVIVVLTLITGGLHVDGLADTCDGFAVKSTGDTETDRERRLGVMKDSATGAIGAASVACAIVLKFALLSSALKGDVWHAAGTVFMLPVVSRWALVAASWRGNPARHEGLGKVFVGGISDAAVAGATLLACLPVGAATAVGAGISLSLPFGIGLVLVCAAVTFLSALFRRRFGGLTGDTLGAVAEISELLFLLVMTAWNQPST